MSRKTLVPTELLVQIIHQRLASIMWLVERLDNSPLLSKEPSGISIYAFVSHLQDGPNVSPFTKLNYSDERPIRATHLLRRLKFLLHSFVECRFWQAWCAPSTNPVNQYLLYLHRTLTLLAWHVLHCRDGACIALKPSWNRNNGHRWSHLVCP